MAACRPHWFIPHGPTALYCHDGTGEFLPEHLNDELGDNELAELAQVASDLREHAVRLAGVVVANLPPDQNHEKVRDQLKGLGIETAALLPHDDSFEKVTVAEIADTVGADLIYGCESVFKNQRVDSMTIATLDVANLLTHLDNADSNHQLVVVDARRADVILAVALAARLKTIAGLLLTGPAVGEETHAVLADLDARKQLPLPPSSRLARARPTRSPTPCRPVWKSSTPSTRPDALVHFHTGLDDDAAHAAHVPLRAMRRGRCSTATSNPGSGTRWVPLRTSTRSSRRSCSSTTCSRKRIVRPCVDITFQAPAHRCARCSLKVLPIDGGSSSRPVNC